jgi:hypothetical protein
MFLKAEELTEKVLAARPSIEAFLGVSDHVPHAQWIKYKNEEEFLLVTFNVLNPAYVSFVNGDFRHSKPPGWWSTLKDQFGLENAPFADPYNQISRENLIFYSIVSLMRKYRRVVVCIQECGFDLAERLNEARRYDVMEILRVPQSERLTDMCVMLCSPDLEPLGCYSNGEYVYTKLFGGKLALYNVHLRYNTKHATETLKEYVGSCTVGKLDTLIVGDFNIPVQPQSEFVKKENSCTANLIEVSAMLENHLRAQAITPLFALHPNHWTNWVPRRNCKDNWDHMDNIMLLSSNPEQFSIHSERWDVQLK